MVSFFKKEYLSLKIFLFFSKIYFSFYGTF